MGDGAERRHVQVPRVARAARPVPSRITELWNYPRVTPPTYEGGRWFYWRNTGLQRQAVVFGRRSLGGPETVVLDPNALSPDGSIALSDFEPSPDGSISRTDSPKADRIGRRTTCASSMRANSCRTRFAG